MVDFEITKGRTNNVLKKHLKYHVPLRGTVKEDLNNWVNGLVHKVSKKLAKASKEYTYVDAQMFREAVEPYENLNDIQLEKIRVMKKLEDIKAECDILLSEAEKDFRLGANVKEDESDE